MPGCSFAELLASSSVLAPLIMINEFAIKTTSRKENLGSCGTLNKSLKRCELVPLAWCVVGV